MKDNRLLIAVVSATMVLSTVGCLPSSQSPTRADLRGPDTASRVPAIVELADPDQPAEPQVVAELIRLLSDEDPAVRMFAIQSLNQRFGQTLGYRYYRSVADRDAAAERWRQWFADHVTPKPITESDATPTP